MPTLLTLVMLPTLLGLGTWQVQRLHWKEGLLKKIAVRSSDDPLEIPHVSAAEADYRPATATGTFKHGLSFFVFASDLKSGKGGYHVLTPLQLTDGAYVLVDRGWIPYERKDQPNGFSHPEGEVTVSGIMRLPPPAGFMQPANDPAKGYWYNIDLYQMADADKLSGFLPYVLELDASKDASAYPVGGQTRLTLPNDHLSYAITWYSMAAILLIIYFVSSWKRIHED